MTTTTTTSGRVAIVGHTGFVGSYILQAYPDADTYNSSNSDAMRYQTYDTVFCAGLYAAKWWANEHPTDDWSATEALFDNLSTVSCRRVVLFSTIDVYQCTSSQQNEPDDDDDACDSSGKTPPPPPCSDTHHAYGRNRYHLETRILTHFGRDRCLIVRLGGLFGFGLKKNLIFDWIHRKPLYNFSVHDSFQWYPMEWLMPDTQRLLGRGVTGVINMFTEPVPNSSIMAVFCATDPGRTDAPAPDPVNRVPITYDCTTRHGHHGRYWRSAEAVLDALGRYLHTMVSQKLVISQLAFERPDLSGDLGRFSERYGITRSEIAPHAWFGADFGERSLEWFRREHGHSGIYSFQALFYPHTPNLFTQGEEVFNHLARLIDIACSVDARVLVFGSPATRRIPPGADVQVCTQQAVEFFKRVAVYIGSRPVIVAIEPNAADYNCNFLTRYTDVLAFLRRVDEPSIQMTLDTGCVWMEGDSVSEGIRLGMQAGVLAHVHFSMPRLQPFSPDGRFPAAMFWLRHFGYPGYVTLELLRVDVDQLEASVRCALQPPTFDIIGAGWFGCHIASKLTENGLPFTLCDRVGAFAEASGHNQNRVHTGCHYPRSFATRSLCGDTLSRFVDTYGCYTVPIKNNIYAISHASNLDAGTYEVIMRHHGVDLVAVNPIDHGLTNCEAAYLTTESYLDNMAAKASFESRLDINVLNRTTPVADNRVGIDCTNGEYGATGNGGGDGDLRRVHTLVLIYRRIAQQPWDPLHAITIMDGEFGSIYPSDPANYLYSLTHVKHGIVSSRTPLSVEENRLRMEEDIQKYYPAFRSSFVHVGHFVATKCLSTSPCASRDINVGYVPNTLRVTCGKICGMFRLEDLIRHTWRRSGTHTHTQMAGCP
jgi:sugar phosphate isomerase/epimerase